ncbi:MAG: glycosyltransferase family 2 protein [Bacteroidota bacterium]
MISFIVIGKNEGRKLSLCLESIKKAVEYSRIDPYEVIYVDSRSGDGSAELASSFENTRVFRITGECNAAIARNIGALEASGNELFFLDGDMELIPSFPGEVLNEKQELKYDCVTGHLDDLIYDTEGSFLERRPVTYRGTLPDRPVITSATGGFFAVRKKHWDEVKGMRTKYKRSQDLDLIIRLRKKGIRTTRIPHLMVLHHTIDYRNESRMWELLFSGKMNYFSLFFRDHLLNREVVLHTLRNYYTAFLLLPLPFTLFAGNYIFMVWLFVYLAALMARVVINARNTVRKNRTVYFIQRLLYQFLRDLVFWGAFLFFHPRGKEISYERVE